MVPYTLPGVLALIGCWWYLSRKKQASIDRRSPERRPGATGLKTSPSEGSNGLVEGAVSPAHTAEDGAVSQKVGAALSAEQSCGDVGREEDDHGEPARRRSSSGLEQDVRDARAAREELAVCPSAQVSCSSPTAHLSEAERPEPEGEVAVLTEDKMVTCALTPPEAEAEDPLETPSVQEFNRHLVTSTPTSAPPRAAQEPAIRPPPSEDVQACGEEEEEQNLQLLASGLITEVISAATQEVLSCSLTDNGRPNCSSTPLGASRPCAQQEPITAEQHHLPPSAARNGCEEAETEDSGMPNGCSPLDQGVHQTNGVQTDQRTAVETHDRKLPADEASALAEDSACSTCHSEDGGSGEDLQSGANRETGRSDAASTQAASAEAAPPGEDNAADEMKRLNGLSLGNGGVGNEAETDQSGGEAAAAVTSCQSWC